MIRQLATAALCGTLLVSTAALADGSWTSESTPMGTMVSNGETGFFAPDAKAGKQMARALNRAERKAESGNGGNSPPPSTDGGGDEDAPTPE